MLLSSKKRVELIKFKKKLKKPFKTSFDELKFREIFLIRIIEGSFEGWGEIVAEKDPLYSYENNKTAETIIKDYLIPVLKKTLIPEEFKKKASKIKGHMMAKAGVELALWDLKAKKMDKPLYKIYGGVRKKIPSGISIGIKESIDELLETIDNSIKKGYLRIKLKISPGKDLTVLKEVREAFPDITLSVDANSSYSPHKHFKLLKRFDEFSLLMIEQPFYEDDLFYHSKLKNEIKTKICLDESLTFLRKVIEGYEMSSYDIINVKTGRVGGPIEVIKINNFAKTKRIPLWMGGMLESGVGRLHNIHLATLSEFTLPSDISESSRYWDKDIIKEPVKMFEPGYLKPSNQPGIGEEVILPDKINIQKFNL